MIPRTSSIRLRFRCDGDSSSSALSSESLARFFDGVDGVDASDGVEEVSGAWGSVGSVVI